MIASMAKAAAVNNKIGYDQSERYTFWEHLKASNYDPAQITIACEADCSSGVAAIVKGAGYRLGNEKMKNVSIYLYTGNMRAGLKAAGFEVLTDSKYLTSDAYLLEGDITLNDNAHVAINLTDGASHPEQVHPTQHQSRAMQRSTLHTGSTRALQELTR